MNEKILITSALLYANGAIHFGHIAGAYLPADAYARFQRLMGSDVLYISGSDEYGVAITLSADLAGRTPKEQVDLFHGINKRLFEEMQISFDHYSRTTWSGHAAPVQQFFLELLESGFIEERVTDQLYSEQEKRFLADRYVVGECPACGFDPARGDECPKCGASYEATQLKNPRSKLTNSPLTHRATKHWFLLLEKFKNRLEEWLSTKNWKPNVMNFIKGYIENLHARAITRDSEWGVPIPLPGTEGKVLYVWFDAPIGYISATMEWAELQGKKEAWKDYWLDPKTKLVNFIGKDNIPFHAAIFPAMIMGQKEPYKLVDEIPANEFYNLEGKKFSKSEEWYVDLEEFLTKYSSDQIRYAIAANAPETTDAEFAWKDFQLRCNSELLGKYGNLVNRVLIFLQKQCNGVIPPPATTDLDVLEKMKSIVEEAKVSFSEFRLRRACQLIMELAQTGNVYFDAKKPWVQAKEDPQAMQNTLRICLECLHLLAFISYPVIPTASAKVSQFLGTPLHSALQEGTKLLPPTILFRRIEDAEIESELARLKK